MDCDCGCSRGCLQRFALDSDLAQQVTAFKARLSSMGSTKDRDRFLYSMMWDLHKKEDGTFNAFQFLGVRVCQSAFLQFLGISKTHYTRRVQSILSGLIEGPVDGRTFRKIREKPAMMNADAFFNFLYLHVAEPLAEGWGHEEWDAQAAQNLDGGLWDEVPKELLEKGDLNINPFDEWILGKGDHSNPDLASGVPVTARDQRWLNHQNIADMYSQYQVWVSGSGGTPVSMTVFQKCWKQNWQGVLRIRKLSQHSRCEDCALYCEFRKQATEGTREQIQAAYNEHLRGVFMDREIASRLSLHSELSTAEEFTVGPSMQTLYCSIDGMDQAGLTKKLLIAFCHVCHFMIISFPKKQLSSEAKFRVPRFRQQHLHKGFEGLFRPPLRNLCMVFHGVCEVYMLLDGDVPKDSNLQMTALSGALSFSFQDLCRAQHFEKRMDFH